jgi:exonuclease VII small subunit
MPESFFGNLPYEEERENVRQIVNDLEEGWSRLGTIPFLIYEKENAIKYWRDAKERLDKVIGIV